MMQHALKLWICLHPADVGAVIDRLRAIDNRPYGFCRKNSLFCDRLLCLNTGILRNIAAENPFQQEGIGFCDQCKNNKQPDNDGPEKEIGEEHQHQHRNRP